MPWHRVSCYNSSLVHLFTCPLYLRHWQTANGYIKTEQKLAVGVFVLWGMLAASLHWQPVCLRGLSDGEEQQSWQDANGCDANELQANKQALSSPPLTSDLLSCLFNTFVGKMSWIQPHCQILQKTALNNNGWSPFKYCLNQLLSFCQ